MTGFGTIALGWTLFAAGCINRATATLSPGADLTKLKTFYVVHQPKNRHGIHNLIKERLAKEGLTATAGPESANPSTSVDSVITYVDRWVWDITLRDTNNAFPITVGNSFHTSLTRKSPEKKPIFG